VVEVEAGGGLVAEGVVQEQGLGELLDRIDRISRIVGEGG
jgi:hypothetical protein